MRTYKYPVTYDEEKHCWIIEKWSTYRNVTSGIKYKEFHGIVHCMTEEGAHKFAKKWKHYDDKVRGHGNGKKKLH